MKTSNFTTTILVDQSPEEVFKAINDPRGWWSEDMEGPTDRLHAEFYYQYKDVHQCTMRIEEFVPNKKVVWRVLENTFNFISDKSEWVGTRIVFELGSEGNKTRIRFTHEGLTPEYECFEICEEAWSNYIQNSLYKRISTGKGEPNPKEGGYNEWLKNKRESQQQGQDYRVVLKTDLSPEQVFERINQVSQWWTGDLEGHSGKLNDVFSVTFGDIHYSKQKISELIPDKKIVWLVTESKLNFVETKDEWTNTRIIFEILPTEEGSELQFTHQGLIPQFECYEGCSQGWDYYIRGSLFRYLTEGTGTPGMISSNS